MTSFYISLQTTGGEEPVAEAPAETPAEPTAEPSMEKQMEISRNTTIDVVSCYLHNFR